MKNQYIKNDIQAILLDMDGTLIDTETIHKEVWYASAKKLGFLIEDAFYDTMIGRPFQECLDMIKDHFPVGVDCNMFHEQLIHHHQIYQKAYRKNNTSYFKKGAENLLQFLANKKEEILVALVTSSSRHSVNNYFGDGLPYSDLFDVIVTCDDVDRYKPDPYPYEKALNLLNVKAENALVVEDSAIGAQSALSASCSTLIITKDNVPESLMRHPQLQIYADLYEAQKESIIPLLTQST